VSVGGHGADGPVDRHVAGCEACRAALRRERALSSALGEVASLPVPQVDVVSTVRLAVEGLRGTDRRLVRPAELAWSAGAATLVGIAVLGAGIAWRAPILEAVRSLWALLLAMSAAASGVLRALEPMLAVAWRFTIRVLEPVVTGLGSRTDDLFRAGASATTVALAFAAALTAIVVGRDLLRGSSEGAEEWKT
jgi:hypothetical protein